MSIDSIYKNLADYFISAPLSALFTLLLGVSMCIVYDETGRYFFKRNEVWVRALYFFSGLLITSWLTWCIALFSLAFQYVFAAMAGMYCITAAWLVFVKRRTSFFELFLLLKVSKTDKLKWLQYLSLTVLVLFFFISLAPPTDADSLDYHLGIPIAILNNHSLWFDKYSLHFRMVGFGEMLNTLGVANGCISLGAFVQMLAFTWLLFVLVDIVPAALKVYLYGLFLGIPVLLFLIPGQKHQLTGIAATSVCFYVLSFYRHKLTTGLLFLWIATLLLAAGIKYSFLLSAFALLFFLLAGSKTPLKSTISFILYGCIFLGPLLLYRYLYFADPLSPLLERFKSTPDTMIVILGDFLHDFRDIGYSFPWGIFIPATLGSISATLGWCAVVLLSVFIFSRKYLNECIVILFLILLTVMFGQKTARFFSEPYLWAMPIVLLNTANSKWGKYILKPALLQLFLLCPFIGYSFYLLVPGIISNPMRDKVLLHTSFGYAESRWIDATVPEDAHIATKLRSRAWLPRPYFPREYLYLGKSEKTAKHFDSMLHAYHINYLVMKNDKFFENLKKRYPGTIIAGPKTFPAVTRNPFNNSEYELVIYRLE